MCVERGRKRRGRRPSHPHNAPPRSCAGRGVLGAETGRTRKWGGGGWAHEGPHPSLPPVHATPFAQKGDAVSLSRAPPLPPRPAVPSAWKGSARARRRRLSPLPPFAQKGGARGDAVPPLRAPPLPPRPAVPSAWKGSARARRRRLSPSPPFAQKGGARGDAVPPSGPLPFTSRRPIRVEGQRTGTPPPPLPVASFARKGGARGPAIPLLRPLPFPLSAAVREGTPPPPFPIRVGAPALPLRDRPAPYAREGARDPRPHPSPCARKGGVRGHTAPYAHGKGAREGTPPPPYTRGAPPPLPVALGPFPLPRVTTPPCTRGKGHAIPGPTLPHGRGREVYEGTPPRTRTGRDAREARRRFPLPVAVGPSPSPVMHRPGAREGTRPGPNLPHSHGRGGGPHAAPLRPRPPLAAPPGTREHATPGPTLPLGRAVRHTWKGTREGKPPPAGGAPFAREGAHETKPSPPPYISRSGAGAVSVRPRSPGDFRAP
ncbi:hypothetical protein EDB83DRAFT_2324249 [Lactarius deliciosus]|nr:hypothetical protein EDB83DRAFT_2324249 [Lactarius deliciosus]